MGRGKRGGSRSPERERAILGSWKRESDYWLSRLTGCGSSGYQPARPGNVVVTSTWLRAAAAAGRAGSVSPLAAPDAVPEQFASEGWARRRYVAIISHTGWFSLTVYERHRYHYSIVKF